jgi:RHS repeat-associated protein
VTSEVWVDGFGNAVKTIVHGYDDAGREISISDGVTAYQYQYDLADRLTQVDNEGSVVPEVTLSMAYDFEGNRVWLSDSMGGNVWYAWNNQRLQSMALYTENYKSAQVGFSYDPVGRMNSISRVANQDYSTPVTTSYTLDLLDRVTGIMHSKGIGDDASLLSQFTYGYDVGGRVISSTGPEGSLSYALDANGQLLSVTGSRSEAYAFDSNGNRTSNSTTAAGNLLLNDGKYSYTYDLEGNQKTKTRISDGQVTEFFWDYRNQLTKAMVKDANGVLLKELRFTYDVEGRRVGSWVDADGAGPEEPDQVWTVFDGVNPYMDFDGDGLLKTRYLYGPGIDELFARIGAGEDPEWYLADRLGSVRQIVDGAGTILDEISYDIFGGILSEANPSQGDRFKFNGREYSPELGIYYYRARWYDPSSGRFISQDPIGFSAGDVNLYRYVGNAPGDASDPSGLVNWWNPFSWTTNELAAFSEGTQDGVLMIYNAATFHQDTQVNAYVNNIIQQNGGTYGFANGSAHVGAYAAYAGVFVWGWGAVGMPTFNVGFQFNGVIPHFIYGTTSNGVTTWAHASGIPGWLYIQVAGPTVVESSFTLMGVPILTAATALPAAYLTTNPDARTCLTAALDAWFHGTVGFRR